jgi:uncharacterized protein DUF397
MNRVDLTGAKWIKSTRSEGNAQCVEVAHVGERVVALRDTKNLGTGPVMIFTGPQWNAFIGGAADGLFDRP